MHVYSLSLLIYCLNCYARTFVNFCYLLFPINNYKYYHLFVMRPKQSDNYGTHKPVTETKTALLHRNSRMLANYEGIPPSLVTAGLPLMTAMF